MNLPDDPIILFSYVNTMLRDIYSSLDEMCKDLCVEKSGIEEKLASVGYTYSEERNRFI